MTKNDMYMCTVMPAKVLRKFAHRVTKNHDSWAPSSGLVPTQSGLFIRVEFEVVVVPRASIFPVDFYPAEVFVNYELLSYFVEAAGIRSAREVAN